MEGKNLLTEKNILFLYVIMFSVGVAGHLIGQLKGLIIPLTPFTLLFLGTVTIIAPGVSANSSSPLREKKFLTWFAVTYLVTFTLEAVGVKTGLIFGEYIYGDTLGIKLFEVPLIIGFNWVLVILGSVILAAKFTSNKYTVAFITGIIAVLFDIILEPVAISLDYWQWAGGAIPLQNYIAWFVISFFAALYYGAMKIEFKSVSPIHYLAAQAVFFMILLIFMS